MIELTISITEEEVEALEKFREKMISFNESQGKVYIAESWRNGPLNMVAGTYMAMKIREEREEK